MANACDGDGRQKFGLLLRRQGGSGGIAVGFASASRQRPLPSRSTRPRLANRPSRHGDRRSCLSQGVVFAHCTTPASGSSRIASSSACSRADSSTPGWKPGGRLERARDNLPGPAPLGFEASVCSHWAIWSRTESGQARIVSIASRSAPSSARFTAYLPCLDLRSLNTARPPCS